MARTSKNKVHISKRPSQTGHFTLVRDISKQYGIEFSGDQNMPLYEHLKLNGNEGLGNALEYLEREIRPA